MTWRALSTDPCPGVLWFTTLEPYTEHYHAPRVSAGPGLNPFCPASTQIEPFCPWKHWQSPQKMLKLS